MFSDKYIYSQLTIIYSYFLYSSASINLLSLSVIQFLSWMLPIYVAIQLYVYTFILQLYFSVIVTEHACIHCFMIQLLLQLCVDVNNHIYLSSSLANNTQKMCYVIYVTWAGGICLVCTHEPEGAQCLRASADISGKSLPHIIDMLCNTSGTLKICQTCLSLYCPFI